MNKSEPGKSKYIFTIAKFFIGVVLFAALLLWKDTGTKLIQVFSSFKTEYIIVLLFLGIIMNLASSMKWDLFLKERGIHVSISRLFGLYLIGKFFNNFMPSMIGGDLTRVYLLGRQIDSHSKSAASVFMERFTGLTAMLLMVLIFALFNIEILSEPIIRLAVIIISFGITFVLIVILRPSFVNFLERRFSFIPFSEKAFGTTIKLLDDISYFRSKYKLISYAMVYSFLFHILTSLNVFLCSLAIGFHPSFLDVAVITPIILLVVTIPVSPNNIGLWEWAFSVLLIHAGATIAQGLAVALMLRANSLVFSLAGGILFLFERAGESAAPA